MCIRDRLQSLTRFRGPCRRARALARPPGVLDLGVQAARNRLREGPLMPPSPYAVDVRDLGIRYNLNLTRRTTLKGSLAEWVGRKQQVGRHFWALRHVNFRIEHGESLGILGPVSYTHLTLPTILRVYIAVV